LLQAVGFLGALRKQFPPPIEPTANDIPEVSLNTHNAV
jgi:hypothetical protein